MFSDVEPFLPPAMRTLPLVVGLEDVLSWIAVCSWRAPVMLPVAAHVPVVRSYNSAVAKVVDPLVPPATSTFPVESTVAVWPCRAVAIDPVVIHVGSRIAG